MMGFILDVLKSLVSWFKKLPKLNKIQIYLIFIQWIIVGIQIYVSTNHLMENTCIFTILVLVIMFIVLGIFIKQIMDR